MIKNFILLFIIILLTGCHSIRKLPKIGDHDYCLVDYKNKIIDCSYDSIEECTKTYDTHNFAHCFAKKYLSNKMLNELERKQ